jgi:SAM-dependent methyltransferase
MNANISDADSSIHYYDSDYPSQGLGPYPENFDEITKFQGLAFDVARYKELAQAYGDPVLELCCGTGRVAIPLAQSGFRVVAVVFSASRTSRGNAGRCGLWRSIWRLEEFWFWM